MLYAGRDAVFTSAELAEHIRCHLHGDRGAIPEHLVSLRDADVADVLNDLSPPEAADVLLMLPEERVARVAAEPRLRRRGELFVELEPARAANLLNDLPADQRAEVLRLMSPHDRTKLLPQLAAHARA